MSESILTLPAPPSDHRIAYGDDPSQFGDLRLPRVGTRHPLAILIHGGYWRSRYDLAYFGHCSADLAARGIATWNIEYRRVGHAGGGWPGTFRDIGDAIDMMRVLAPSFHIDLTRVALVGHSAGGHLALWAAGRHRLPADSPLAAASPLAVRAVVALAPVADVREAWRRRLSSGAAAELMGGAPADHPARYRQGSPAELLPLGVRQLVFHGRLDADVPFEISADYVARARAAGDPAELIGLADTGHFETVDPRTPQWQRVVEAMSQELAEGSGAQG